MNCGDVPAAAGIGEFPAIAFRGIAGAHSLRLIDYSHGRYDRFMIQLLTVCTGNICRSPFAERMLQAELDSRHPGQFLVRSAGTESMVGDGMEAESADLLAEFGGSADAFVSRQLSPAMLAEMNVVIGLTTAHRDAAIRMSPRMLKRAFTLVEFARIMRHLRTSDNAEIIRGATPELVQQRWQGLGSVASANRSATKPSAAGDDVVDPYRRSAKTHMQMVEEILPAVEEILAFETWASQAK